MVNTCFAGVRKSVRARTNSFQLKTKTSMAVTATCQRAGAAPSPRAIAVAILINAAATGGFQITDEMATSNGARVSAAAQLVKLSGRSVASVEETLGLLWPNGGHN